MTKCRFILMNKGVDEHDFTCEAERPLIDEHITVASGSSIKTYEVVFIQHTFKEDGTFKYIMVTGIRKN